MKTHQWIVQCEGGLHLRVAAQISDYIAVMRQGRIAASFAPDAPEKALYDAMLASAPAACP